VGATVQGSRSPNAAFDPLVLTARLVTRPTPAVPPARPACTAPPVIDSFKAELTSTTAGGQGLAVFRLRSRNGTRAVVWPSYRAIPLNGEVKLPAVELEGNRPVFYVALERG
jgi:hypothetical protein